MDNNFDNNTPETNTDPKPETTYTDPNAGAAYTYGTDPKPEVNEEPKPGYTNDNAGYNQPGQGYNQPNNGYQNNYNNYNNGYNSYNNNYQNPQNGGMDTTPLSLGEWLLTLLAGIIPCAGIILYFIWAFGKSGNLHRRNFCRAYLILEGIGLVLGIIFLIFMMVVGFGSYRYSYYY